MSPDPILEGFGVPAMGFVVIALFYASIGVIIFGTDIADDSGFVILYLFFCIGTTFLIGQLSWLILALPALVFVLVFLYLTIR